MLQIAQECYSQILFGEIFFKKIKYIVNIFYLVALFQTEDSANQMY